MLMTLILLFLKTQTWTDVDQSVRITRGPSDLTRSASEPVGRQRRSRHLRLRRRLAVIASSDSHRPILRHSDGRIFACGW